MKPNGPTQNELLNEQREQPELPVLELDSDSDYLYRDELLHEAEQPDSDSNYPMNGQNVNGWNLNLTPRLTRTTCHVTMNWTRDFLMNFTSWTTRR